MQSLNALTALSIGGAMIDTIAVIANDHIEQMRLHNAERAFLLLEEGRKIEAVEMSAHCGGGGANAAVALSRLGLKVAALVKLGRDVRADAVLDRLAAENVDTRWIARDDHEPTGASVHVSSHDRDAAIFTFRGANTRLGSDDLDERAFAVDLVYVANLSNQSADRYGEILGKAKAQGALFATNPGSRQLSAHAEAFEAALPKVDFLALNRSEAEVVAGYVRGPSTSEITFPEDRPAPRLVERGLLVAERRVGLRSFFTALRAQGVGCIVVTDGIGGAFAASGGEILHCAAVETKVAATSGAGDAFASTCAGYLAARRPVADALRAASINAASVLGFVDTQTGLMDGAALEAALGRGDQSARVTTWLL